MAEADQDPFRGYLQQLKDGFLPDSYQLHCRMLMSESWVPQAREGGTMTTVGFRIYLLGGQSLTISKDLSIFHRSNLKWSRGDYQGQFIPRFGHTATRYGSSSIVFFGGMNHFERRTMQRSCINQVHVLNTTTMEIEYNKPSGSMIFPRRYHSAAIVGMHLVIHGGLDEKNRYLDDMAQYNLVTYRWSIMPVSHGPGQLAYHTMWAVYPPSVHRNPNFDIYTPVIQKSTKPTEKVQYPGIYLFGGMFSDGQLNQTLYYLKTGAQSLSWSKLTPGGQAPEARFLHTFTYAENLNVIIIYGGRSNSFENQHHCFNDVHFLNLDVLNWARVEIHGAIGPPRAAHWAAVLESQLFIFGGSNSSTFWNSDMVMFELDRYNVQQLIKEDESYETMKLRKEDLRRKRGLEPLDETRQPRRLVTFQVSPNNRPNSNSNK